MTFSEKVISNADKRSTELHKCEQLGTQGPSYISIELNKWVKEKHPTTHCFEFFDV